MCQVLTYFISIGQNLHKLVNQRTLGVLTDTLINKLTLRVSNKFISQSYKIKSEQYDEVQETDTYSVYLVDTLRFLLFTRVHVVQYFPFLSRYDDGFVPQSTLFRRPLIKQNKTMEMYLWYVIRSFQPEH